MKTNKLSLHVCLLSMAASISPMLPAAAAPDAVAEVKHLSVNGGIEDGKARLIIEAFLNRPASDNEQVLYATTLQHSIKVAPDELDHTIALRFEILQGAPVELVLTVQGSGEFKEVSGPALQDWGIRQSTNGQRVLVLRLRKEEAAAGQKTFTVTAVQPLPPDSARVVPLTLEPPHSALFSGYVRVAGSPETEVRTAETTGLVPIENKFLPETMRTGDTADASEPLAFRFQGANYSLPLQLAPADPDARRVALRDVKIVGQMSDTGAAFTLNALASVKNPKGGSLALLGGGVALTQLPSHPDWRVELKGNQYIWVFQHPGEYPLHVQFDAAVQPSDGWNSLDFRVAPSALLPISLRGLAADTRFEFSGAARPERVGDEFVSHLPPSGRVNLRWKEARAEVEGKLFYAAEMLSQIAVSPGVMVQSALLDYKVMQGELSRVAVRLHGGAEVTRVQGDHVLSWKVLPDGNAGDRQLTVELNQPQQDHFSLQVQMQTPLGAFPQVADVTRISPAGATRFAGHLRVVNEGAVRLEMAQSPGLSQISPEQFPETDATRTAFRSPGTQRFAYRFSGTEYGLRIQADQILPELAVSEVVEYRLAENETAIDGELELDIREAPLRELALRVPRGYTLAKVAVANLSDYFLNDRPEDPDAELRLVYTQPVVGRQLIQVRLERNQPLATPVWGLPRIDIPRAKSVRGQIAVSADPGFRLSAERTQSLTETATAFFPKKITGLQTAFRLNDPAWQASIRIERLAQTVQADVLHLFSVGEGIAYGSSVISYMVSGAPISSFQVELSSEYSNVEFTGKDVRNWQKSTNGYIVQLHTPISGAFTLLASYERPFRAQGETLSFTGARPVDAQSEQGHTLVVSTYQFQVRPVEVSSGLLPLEAGEVPPEYRLFFDAPVLSAYRYTARPFNLRLALSPLAQGDSLSQVVDRAALTTRISKAGQVLTDVRYYVKNRGNPHFRLTVPDGVQLWSAAVNGVAAVPVTDGKDNLIPLPQKADPNAVVTLDLKLASRSSNPRRVSLAAPSVAAPVMLAEWKVRPDTGQRLRYRSGSLKPAQEEDDRSGFSTLAQLYRGNDDGRAWALTIGTLLLLALAIMVWRWTARDDVYRFTARHIIGLGLGGVAFAMAIVALIALIHLSPTLPDATPRDLTFLAPVQQSGSGSSLEILNLEDKVTAWQWLGWTWPALLALLFWAAGAISGKPAFWAGGWVLGWVLLAWATLRSPNGLPAFGTVLIAFLLLHVLLPALRRLGRAPSKPKTLVPGINPGPATATVLLILEAFLGLRSSSVSAAPADQQSNPAALIQREETNAEFRTSERPGTSTALADSVRQALRVDEKFVLGKAVIHWNATRGQLLPLLSSSAVVVGLDCPTNLARLIVDPGLARKGSYLLALEAGAVEVHLSYQVDVRKREMESGFELPTSPALVNTLDLTLDNLDVDVVSPSAVSLQRRFQDGRTTARIVLAPVTRPWVGWRPRSRDVKGEKPVFYAELTQRYIPSAGVIEGTHMAVIRPAQGELSDVVFRVPSGASITDVLDSSTVALAAAATNTAPKSSTVSLWRFDPDTRKLRVTLHPPQSKTFTLIIRSQLPTGPLPMEQTVGLVSTEGAAGEIGLLGFATGKEVQLDSLTPDRLTPINLEDFPSTLLPPEPSPPADLTLRRAFRYAETNAIAKLKVSAVEPDVRVESQDTLSLSEDRVVLAAKPTVNITRAGIFRLSFVLPPSLDVESVSGDTLSHWTESKVDAGRVITLHLRGKTEGQQSFAISLTGPGLKAATNWVVPQIVLREAAKQRGSMVVVPEQGMRLQVGTREGLTQLDPQKSGIRQKGVLAFRVLQAPSKLTLDIEQVDPWIQVTGLQHAAINEALVKVTANLQYQIENTGLKSLRLLMPTNADNVRFQAEHIADYRPVAGTITNGLQQWEVKLQRRVIGTYFLQVNYSFRTPDQASEIALRGLQTLDANLQRGFVTVQSGGRLQVRIENPPPTVQPTEWQSIPRVLQQDLTTASANFAFRLVEPAFTLPLKVDRHPAAKLLAARVNSITLKSVIADDGAMLTHVQLGIFPGDKRLLQLTLPKGAKFWFAFVNQNGVWPWREQDRILIPLEPQARNEAALPVEFFYSSTAGEAARPSLDLRLLAPQFDLPLENITWQVYLNDKWQLKHWNGSLQLEEHQVTPAVVAADLQVYLRNEATAQQEKTKQAEQMLSLANSALEQGDPEHARRAFQAAFGLSQGDQAFNEDARVQLNNLKVQQALMGLNVRQAAVAGESDPTANKLRELRSRKNVAYTQQDAKAIIDSRNPEENAAFLRLAQRLIQQQDAAVSSPAVIRTSVPEQGQLLTFKRAVLVDTWADLHIGLDAIPSGDGSWMSRAILLGALLIGLGALALATRPFKTAG